MSTVQKISVSVGREELAWARRRARLQGTSLSAVVSDALLRQRRADAGLGLLAELGTSDITLEDLQALRAELGWAPKRRSSRRKVAG